jgi:predicted TIM-barrel fold metal-dependent hydrolase
MAQNLGSKPAQFIVDVHQHWFPMEALKKSPGLRKVDDHIWVTETRGISSLIYQDFYDIDLSRKVNAEAGVDMSILLPSMEVTALAAAGMPVLDASRKVHDVIGALIASRAGLASLATVSPFDPASLAEAERAIKDLGFGGLCLESSWMGRWYDTEAVYPYFEFAQANGYTIFLHPPQLPYGAQIMNKWRLEEVVGRPADTSMSVARMIFSGLLDRYPDVQIVLAHMAGDVIPILGRLDFGHRLGYEGLPTDQRARNKLRPSEYIRRNFYADTMGFNLPMLAAAAEVFGPERLMFGSDYGPVPISPAEHIKLVNQLDLTAPQREDIFWRNANRQFGLSLHTTTAARC